MAHAGPVTLIYSTNHKVPRRFLLGAALLSLLVAAVIFIHSFIHFFVLRAARTFPRLARLGSCCCCCSGRFLRGLALIPAFPTPLWLIHFYFLLCLSDRPRGGPFCLRRHSFSVTAAERTAEGRGLQANDALPLDPLILVTSAIVSLLHSRIHRALSFIQTALRLGAQRPHACLVHFLMMMISNGFPSQTTSSIAHIFELVSFWKFPVSLTYFSRNRAARL